MWIIEFLHVEIQHSFKVPFHYKKHCQVWEWGPKGRGECSVYGSTDSLVLNLKSLQPLSYFSRQLKLSVYRKVPLRRRQLLPLVWAFPWKQAPGRRISGYRVWCVISSAPVLGVARVPSNHSYHINSSCCSQFCQLSSLQWQLPLFFLCEARYTPGLGTCSLSS